jgi:hypothetical protein
VISFCQFLLKTRALLQISANFRAFLRIFDAFLPCFFLPILPRLYKMTCEATFYSKNEYHLGKIAKKRQFFPIPDNSSS